jgi:hypothetical protein
MWIKNLYQIVERLILPRFPWITDFVWSTHYHDGITYWTLEITPSKEFVDSEVFMDRHEVAVEDEMKSLFSMMGPEPNQMFDRVIIKGWMDNLKEY